MSKVRKSQKPFNKLDTGTDSSVLIDHSGSKCFELYIKNTLTRREILEISIEVSDDQNEWFYFDTIQVRDSQIKYRDETCADYIRLTCKEAFKDLTIMYCSSE